jgi:hypothetical protein
MFMKKKIIAVFLSALAFNNPAFAKDLVEFIDIDQSPIPLPPSELMILNNNKMNRILADDGFSHLEKNSTEINNFTNSLNMAKSKKLKSMKVTNIAQSHIVYEKLSDLKFSFKPLNFNQGSLIGVLPHGTFQNNVWTGVDRFFDIPNIGVARLEELDLAANQGKVYMFKTEVNTKVRGKKAISKVFLNNISKLENISWVENNMSYTLTFQPIKSTLKKTEVSSSNSSMKNIQPTFSAYSLTKELK